jgi:tetratricopeptide (TPR) repeat protein
MSEEKTYTLKQAHRQFAIECNGEVWKLLSKKDCTDDETERMIHVAHTSHYHWLHAGDAANKQRGEWLLYKVYAEVGNAERATHYAEECFKTTEENRKLLKDFDIAYAHEALARTYAMNGEFDKAKEEFLKAENAGNAIVGEEDKKIFDGDFKSGNWFNLL